MEHANIVVVGSANMDFVLSVPHLPRAGETAAGGDLALFEGGKGANQACAAARLGGRVSMAGQVGGDVFGERLIASLRDAGVDATRVGRSARPTGCACIYVLPDGENSIVISAGANASVLPENILPRLDLVGPKSFLLLQLEIPLETVAAALAHGKARGATTILDPAPARRLPDELLANVDILTPNQFEAAALLGTPDLEIRDYGEARQAAERLTGLSPAIVLKLGGLGCYVASGRLRQSVPGFAVQAVDSTAAGDVFNGALAVALAEGQDLPAAARFANAAAAISVTRAGAQPSIPSRAEADRFIENPLSRAPR